MEEEIGTWGEYSKLVLKELERLNSTYSEMRKDIDTRFGELNQKLNDVKNIDGAVKQHSIWMDKVTEVWSPSQMQQAKDELYKQKNRWVAAIAVITFVQIAVGIALTVWGNLK